MKLYTVVRGDLPPGAQLAQSVHAMRLFVADHPDVDRAWYETSNNLVCLSVPDQAMLEQLAERAASAGVEVSMFTEPDLDDQPTALAIGPAGARLVSSLPLALRSYP